MADSTPQAAVHLLYHELERNAGSYRYALGTAEFTLHCELYQTLALTPGPIQPFITFDDGHRSFYDHALPILTERELHAHHFITAGWTAQRADYMNWQELQAVLSAGHRLGAHGWSHALLTGCSDRELHHELKDTRDTLEQRLGIGVTSLSFPGGRFNRRVLHAAREAGYTELYTSQPHAERLPFGELRGRVNLRQNTTTEALEALLVPNSASLRRLERLELIKSAARSILGDRRYAQLWALLNRQQAEELVSPVEAPR